MAKVTLVRPTLLVPTWSDSGPLTPPIGPAYLASSLREVGHEVRIVDGVGENPFQVTSLFDGRVAGIGLTSEEIADRVAQTSDVDLVGVSCMFSQDWPEVRRLIRMIRRRLPDVPIVTGGEHITAVPEFTLATVPEVDYCVLGEGEQALVELVDSLFRGDGPQGNRVAGEGLPCGPVPCDPGAVAGVVSRDAQGGIRRGNVRARIRDLDSIPPPAWDLVPIDNYLDHELGYGVNRGRSMPMLATRGCPYECTFCSNPLMWTTRWAARKTELVLEEMERYIQEYRATNFDFYDLTAVVQRDWIVDFCRLILKRGHDITWQLPSGTRSEALDGEVTRLMYQAGCRNMSYAPESGSVAVLRRIKKKVKLDRLESSVKAAVRNSVNVKLNIIMGFPDETRREIWQTIRFLARMGAAGIHDASVSLFSPYPGSEIFNDLVESGGIGEMNDDFFLSLGTYKDFSMSTSYATKTSGFEINLYRMVGMATFYGVQYLVRPWRLVSLLSNLLRGKQESRLDKSLQDLARRFGKSRRPAGGYNVIVPARGAPR